MKINELIKKPLSDFRRSDPWPQKSVAEFMTKYGLTQISKGASGAVYGHPKLNYILKVFEEDDIGYNLFLNYAINKGSIYLPKFIGKPMLITPTWKAIRMEKLVPLSIMAMQNTTMIKYYLDAMFNKLEIPHPNPIANKNVKFYGEEIKNIYSEELVYILNDIAAIAVAESESESDYFPGPDLGSANMMMRGSQLVITDPLA